MFLSRRQFLKASAGTVAAAAVADQVLALTALQPVIEVGNPLGDYPDRSWERVYHDQYRYDSSFTWVCSPNDTHACRIRAFVRNGVVMRVEQNYDHHPHRLGGRLQPGGDRASSNPRRPRTRGHPFGLRRRSRLDHYAGLGSGPGRAGCRV